MILRQENSTDFSITLSPGDLHKKVQIEDDLNFLMKVNSSNSFGVK